jgi:hypothetical protein
LIPSCSPTLAHAADTEPASSFTSSTSRTARSRARRGTSSVLP